MTKAEIKIYLEKLFQKIMEREIREKDKSHPEKLTAKSLEL